MSERFVTAWVCVSVVGWAAIWTYLCIAYVLGP